MGILIWAIVMWLHLCFRWRKRSIQTESSSLPCFIKSSTKSKNISMKVMICPEVPSLWHLYAHQYSICPHHHDTMLLVTDDTDNINQVIGSNSPESCLSYLTDLEKKGDPHLDRNHLTRLVDFYTRVFSNMPLGKHCQNESYARMLVRFAELNAWVNASHYLYRWSQTDFVFLKSVHWVCFSFFSVFRIQDVNEAEANFNVARSHSQNFAFVHIAHAQFEHSQGREMSLLFLFIQTCCHDLSGLFQCVLYHLTRQHKEGHLHIAECYWTWCETKGTAGSGLAKHARENTSLLLRG